MASTSKNADSHEVHHRWSYDVFLSFRGEDTRTTFTNYLYANLQQKGINTFIDDEELRRGDQIGPLLLQAIEESKMAVIVLSPNYATSSWCLDELAKIIECSDSRGPDSLIPIFYHVDPLEVEDQTGKFGEAMQEHKTRLGPDLEKKLPKWSDALRRAATARTRGSEWHLDKGREAEFVESIAQEVAGRIKRMLLYVAKYPVGIDFHLDELNSMLSIGAADVRMIGIWGTGGIGKTTVAKASFNSIVESFEGSCFLANVREVSEQYNGLVHLQQLLLTKIIGDKNTKVENVDHGMDMIMTRLRYKRVLIVLDDVDRSCQLESLVGSIDWFAPGSRIIVTTRDEHVIAAHGANHRYKIKGLSDEDSLRLLSWHAFGIPSAPKGYDEVTASVANYAKGLPLVLTVLGSLLRGRSITEWKWTVNRLREIPDPEISHILEISFDRLGRCEKEIFLDVACFLKRKNKDYVTKMLDSCELFPKIGIPVLVEKSLIFIEGNELHMHDLIQQMGREIVRRESPIPGNRSRLWYHEDVVHVLQGDTGTDAVEGMLVDLPQPDEILLNAKSFVKMQRLRLLIINNAVFSGSPEYLPNGLRWLEWKGYPSSSMPPDFHPRKLAVLQLRSTNITRLWQSSKRCSNLTIMELTKCDSLYEIPDLSTIPNLEKLMVNQCKSLVTVHESVGFLKKLVFLNFGDCSNLRTLPTRLKMRSLETISITCCPRLKKFPDVEEIMENIKSVDLSNTAIIELPETIGNFTGIQHMDLHSCGSLISLPGSIYKFKNIEDLHLNDCTMLTEFPIDFLDGKFSFPMLDFLNLSNSGIVQVDFLEAPHCFPRLETLDLSATNLVTLSSRISNLPELKFLVLQDCKQLTELPELPPNLCHVNAKGCSSLELCRTRNLRCSTSEIKIDFSNCHKLGQPQMANEFLDEELLGNSEFHFILPGSDIPNWFGFRSTDQPSMYFEVHSCVREKFVGLAASAVFSFEDRVSPSIILTCDVSINDEVAGSLASTVDELESDHVWIGYFPAASLLEEMCDGWNNFQVTFKLLDEDDGEFSGGKIKEFAVRFVSKSNGELNNSTEIRIMQAESSKDDSADMLVDSLLEDVKVFDVTESDQILAPKRKMKKKKKKLNKRKRGMN